MPCAGRISFSMRFFLFLFAVSIQMSIFATLNILTSRRSAQRAFRKRFIAFIIKVRTPVYLL